MVVRAMEKNKVKCETYCEGKMKKEGGIRCEEWKVGNAVKVSSDTWENSQN